MLGSRYFRLVDVSILYLEAISTVVHTVAKQKVGFYTRNLRVSTSCLIQTSIGDEHTQGA